MLSSLPTLAMPRLGLASFRRRIIFRSAFVLLTLATLVLALALLTEERQRSFENYRLSIDKTHAEIVAKGVGWVYGANEGASINFFERAINLEPKIIIHRVEYAKAMLLLNRDKFKAAAKTQLEIALTLDPKDALERKALDAARRGLVQLK